MSKLLPIHRRHALGLLGGAFVWSALGANAQTLPVAAPAGKRHGMSIFGELKYPRDFPQFEYVNPNAPKGGVLSQSPASGSTYNVNLLSFDSFNGFILKGDTPPGLHFTFDTLMVRAYDEPDALYGLVASSVETLDKGNRLIFELRDARFHDGTPLTAEDAAFSFMLLKKSGHPIIAQYLSAMSSAKALDARHLEIRFTGKQTRDLPQFIAGDLPILSKAYYSKVDFTRTSLTPPLGSGPYRVGPFKQGSFVTYERMKNYWARDLNVNKGQWNFDKLRYVFYRDRIPSFEAFSAGQYLLREEFTSKVWATQYNFPAVKDGRVKLLTLPDETPSGTQGWFINTRRPHLTDVRVREALGLAFDFDWTNKNHFYGLYKRTASFFENSPMRAEGSPSAEEIAILAPFKDQLSPRVFGPVVTPPKSDGTGQDRRLLRQAMALLDQAGWKIVDGARRNAKGEVLSIEFLNDEPQFERIESPFLKNLKLLGIDAKPRMVDSAQYQDRLKNYDFDILIKRYSIGLTPGLEMRAFWNSGFGKSAGSHNVSGINDPVVDALIEKAISAPSREALIATTRALDRVLRAGFYWIPQWYKASHGIAYWDVFGRPAKGPRYDRGIERGWWFDSARASKLGIKG
jgi:microcin C transport system substrate-binding protein